MRGAAGAPRRTLVLAAAVLAISTLAGCEVPGIEPGTAEEFQAEVARVTTAAESGQYEQALRDLDDLTVRLDTATRQGEVSRSREERISAAIAAVRLDLQREIAEQD